MFAFEQKLLSWVNFLKLEWHEFAMSFRATLSGWNGLRNLNAHKNSETIL